jgi:formylmethanofuran dehydrogenase subunit E-like metal-binding protein
VCTKEQRQKNVKTAERQWKLLVLLSILTLLLPASTAWARTNGEYLYWKQVGGQVGLKAIHMIRKQVPQFKIDDCLALTNAGYAEINGHSTMGTLDGLSRILRVSRGDHSLLEMHSASNSPLWFAVYDKESGICVYLEVDPNAIHDNKSFNISSLFSTVATEQINAEHLYENAAVYAEKFDNKIFNGNEFRIVTVANAMTAGVSTRAVRAFEFHDHYCPGVTSGIIMADYIEKFFPLDHGGSYFLQSVQPWCKEDALMVLLNTTPGKKSYAITYPTEDDIASWPTWAKDLSTIVYRYDPLSEIWQGIALEYNWEETGCPDYGHSVMNKLCTDLWYLDRMDQPENFVTILKNFELPPKVHPKEYARPDVDPVFLLNF